MPLFHISVCQRKLLLFIGLWCNLNDHLALFIFRYIRLLDQVIEYQVNSLGPIDTSMVTFSSGSFVHHDDKTDSVLSTANRCRTPSVASSCSSLCDGDSCIDDFLSWNVELVCQYSANTASDLTQLGVRLVYLYCLIKSKLWNTE